MNSIAFFEIKDREKEYIQRQLGQANVSFFAEKLSEETAALANGFQVISIFVDSQITKKILDALPNLKMISTRSTGFDHIDLVACQQKNITVCNVPHYGDNAVAEYAFGLLLDLSRKIHQSIEKVKDGGFSFEGLAGFDLKGKTIGIVGMGNIGRHVARIANGFEMEVLACDPNQDKKLAKKLGFKYVLLEELLKNSDIITLHAPYNEHTHHIINVQNISLIKPGAYLINTARGGLVQTDALVRALQKGILAGAGLDVLEEEGFMKDEDHLLSEEISKKYDVKTVLEDHMLMEKDNVIITPHNAFNSKEALEKILETTVENIQSFVKGKPINTVN